MPSEPVALRLGHSPDPDDAFMFYGLARDKIDTGRWHFEHVLQDIQTLSDRATRGDLEITAISVASYPRVSGLYALTSCGASMGDGYGPMLVTPEPATPDDLRGRKIAVPGTLTSAFLACQLRLGKAGDAFEYEVVMFDDIPAAVLDGRADAGLLIHEGQLTYRDMGLHLVEDLGIWWQQKTGLPLPLGGNCIRKDLDGLYGPGSTQEVTNLLKQSIAYSLDHRPEAVDYALGFGRGLDTTLADRFVGMYVNHWTLDYGARGREAIRRFLADGASHGFIPPATGLEFVNAS